MADYPAVFDEVYSVSDIHMGGVVRGRDSFQIFNRGERLGNLCRHLAGLPNDLSVCLVLNGDVIDSLAEPSVGYVALDEVSARTMMQRIFDDPSFKPVWDGLADLVATENRHLVIVSGNHDIELGLPVVEHMIRERLTGGSGLADSRITFSGRGAGYSCKVGAARVYFTHGNEFDPANRVDNEKLGQLANAQNARRPVSRSEWTPNAGTRLVVDVMNDVKERYAFVDLLKPMRATVAAILLVVGRDALWAAGLGDAFRIGKSFHRSAAVQGDLLVLDEADDAEEPDDPVGAMLGLLGPNLAAELDVTPGMARTEDELLLAVVQQELADSYDLDEVASDEVGETLGPRWEIAKGLILRRKAKPALREALKDWIEDSPHRQTDQDDWLSEAVRDRDPAVEFTVAGHTHRARALTIDEGRTFYYNSGTWIRLMQITQEVLEEDTFDPLWEALNDGSLAALDALQIPGPDGPQPLIDDFTTAVRIRRNDRRTVGELVQVTDAGGGVSVEPLPGTERST